MALNVNLRHLEEHSLQLQGQLTVADLDLDIQDELIHVENPVEYDLEIDKLDEALLVEGRISLRLKCECARCLKEFPYDLVINPFTLHVPLSGEDAIPINNDCVDLTPYLREDILLGFPQHPLCEPECRGLLGQSQGNAKKANKTGRDQTQSSAWAELNKLKF